MHAASIGLGINVRLLAETSDSSAAQVVHDVTVGDYTDRDRADFAAGCDVVTFDHEHVPTGLLRELESTAWRSARAGRTGARPGQGDHAGATRFLRAPCPATGWYAMRRRWPLSATSMAGR
jgi:5-(carboxyamino)imidazole ribonucleotide synthase